MFIEPIEPAEIIWRDGMPYSTVFSDVYFSREDGLSETQYVFIEGNRLKERWQSMPNGALFVIAETGFGSGLNFLASWNLFKQHAPQDARLHFISVEKHPLKKSDLDQALALWPSLAIEAKALVENYPVLTPGYHVIQFDEGRITLTLMLGDIVSCYRDLLSESRSWFVNAWFLDGFAPSKNPEMWSFAFFKMMARLSSNKTSVSTFSSAGLVKQGLSNIGFEITKKSGFGKKRQMIVGIRKERQEIPHCIRGDSFLCKRQATILGAGLAGSFIAHFLAQKGWNVRVIDQHEAPGMGASANPQAILYPNLSAYRAPLTTFMLSAFLFAVQFYQKILNVHPNLGDLSGLLQLAVDDKTTAHHLSLRSWLKAYPELGCLVSKEEASLRAGIDVNVPALLIPASGWLNAKKLCEYLLCHPRIKFQGNYKIDKIESIESSVVILAAGYQSNLFKETMHLPLKSIRGQMTEVLGTDESQQLKIPLCGQGHLLPAQKGRHYFGATYQTNRTDLDCLAIDDIENLKKLHALPLDKFNLTQITNHWAGIRVATPNYLPIVGPVAERDHLYLCTGFGSRGLTSIPLSAYYLACLINQEPHGLTQKMADSLAFSRFMKNISSE